MQSQATMHSSRHYSYRFAHSSSYHPSLSLSLLFLLLQCIIHPIYCQSSTTTSTTTTTTADDTQEEEGQYTEIYLTMIIIFAILFVVVIFCLIYRIYKKRQEENADPTRTASDKKANQSAKSKNGTAGNAQKDNMALPAEQVKFRGSMSSVEHRHERIPSKPVVISITTPKGTRHVADMFNQENEEATQAQDTADGAQQELQQIDERTEDEYNAKKKEQQQQTAAAEDDTANTETTQINNASDDPDANIANGNDENSAET